MSVQQKLFRKFFYENSSFLDSEVKFIEITNTRVAERFGIKDQDEITIVQNSNIFGKLEGSTQFKLLNLELEKLVCEPLKQAALEKRYVKYLKDFTQKEFENEFLLSEDHIEEIFGMLTRFVEDSLFSKSPILYA